MKRFLLPFMVLLSGLASAGDLKPDTVELFIKTSSRFTDQIYEGAGISVYSSNTEIGQLFRQYNVFSVQRAFQLKDPLLDDIYLVRLAGKPADPQELIAELQSLDIIEFAEFVPLYEVFYTPNDLHPSQWHLNTVNAKAAWDLQRNAGGVTIAVVDDAVDLGHPDLSSSIWVNPGEVLNGIDDDNNGYVDDINGYDAADQDNDPNPPSKATSSVFSHGTHCAGIAAATTDNNTGIASLGFNAKIIAVKTAPNSGVGRSLPAAYKGMEYAITVQPHIISMSWGGGAYSATYQALFNVAHQKGIILVAAAGNSNSSTPMYPASYDHVISVAATDDRDMKASFTNYGSTIDVSAPGVDIWSTVPGTSRYDFKSGTSMACPLVSGLCALMVAQSPGISPDSVEACLKRSATDIDALNPAYKGKLGAGRIDAEAALDCSKGIVNANFISDKTYICPDQYIQFQAKMAGQGGISYFWEFEGGIPATSTAESPRIHYPAEGQFKVKLTVTGSSRQDAVVRDDYIEVRKPSASMSGNYIIEKGNKAFLPVSFTGVPPFNLTYSDGGVNRIITGITAHQYYIAVSPETDTEYKLISVEDKLCNGSVDGLANVQVIPADSSCVNPRFSLNFTTPGSFRVHCTLIKEGAIYITGARILSNGTKHAVLFKLDSRGGLIWSREYDGIWSFGELILADDGSDLLLKGGGNNDVTLTRVDEDGNLVWTKILDFSADRWYTNIVRAGNDEYYIGGAGNSSGVGDDDLFVLKMKGSDGSIVWEKRFHKGDDQLWCLMSNGKGGVYVGGNDGRDNGAIAEINKDGKFIQRMISDNTTNCRHLGMIDDDIISLAMPGVGTVPLIVSRWNLTDPANPKAIWSTKLNITSEEYLSRICVNPVTKNIYLMYIDAYDRKERIVLLNENGKLLESVLSGNSKYLGNMAFEGDELVYIGTEGINSTGNTEIMVIRRKDTVGMDNCLFTPTQMTVSGHSAQVSLSPMTERSVSFKVKSPSSSVSTFTLDKSCLCENVNRFQDTATICYGDSVRIRPADGARYTWLPSVGLDPVDLTDSTPWVKPLKTTTFIGVSTNCECYEDSMFYTVVVRDPVAITITGDSVLCGGDTLDLSIDNSFKDVQWEPVYNLIPVDDHQVRIFPDRDTFYHVYGRDESGCYGRDTQFVQYDSCCMSAGDFIITDPLLCEGEQLEVQHQIKQKTGAVYSWLLTGPGVSKTFDGYEFPAYIPPNPGDYRLTLFVYHSCAGVQMTRLFSVVDLNIAIGDDTVLCFPDTIQLGFSPVSDHDYEWIPSFNLSDHLVSNPYAGIQKDITYVLKVTDLVSGCESYDTLKVMINEPPDMLGTSDTALCNGDSLRITLPGGDQYHWSNGSWGSGYMIRGETLIWVETQIGHCTYRDSLRIDYLDEPGVELPHDTTFCHNKEISVTARVTDGDLLWLHDGSTSPTITIKEEGWYALRVTNACGETLDSFLAVNKNCKCLDFIANVVTPNGDLKNEVFIPVFTCQVSNYSFLIYNRWGELIFESNDPGIGWDGTYNGQELPEGTYFWVMIYTDGDQKERERTNLSGIVTLIR